MKFSLPNSRIKPRDYLILSPDYFEFYVGNAKPSAIFTKVRLDLSFIDYSEPELMPTSGEIKQGF